MKPLNHKEQELKNNLYFVRIFNIIIFLSFIVLSTGFVSASNITFTSFDAKYIANTATATKLCIEKTNGTYPVAESFGNPYAVAASWTGSVNIKYWDTTTNQWITKGSHAYINGDPCQHPPVIRTLTCRNMNPGEISRLDFTNSVEISYKELHAGSPLQTLSSGTEFMSSIESAKKICELKGYSDVINFRPASWCNGGNWELAWNGTQWEKLQWAATSTYSYGHLDYGITCREIACSSNLECDDDNLYTYDQCINPGNSESYCNHTAIKCIVDNDCGFSGFFGAEFCSSNDVFKNYQESKCLNPGTIQSSCKITTVPTFLIDCGENVCNNYESPYCYQNNAYHSRLCNEKGCSDGECFGTWKEEETLIEVCAKGCSSGFCNPECSSNADCSDGKSCINNKCVKIECFNDNDCNDNNPRTEDKCLNPGTVQSSCQHNNITCSNNADCGYDGFLNMLRCKNNDIYDVYKTFTCNNPGTIFSLCTNSSEERLVQECRTNQICSNNKCADITCSSDSQCNDNNPKTEDKCINPGTVNSKCEHNNIICSTNGDCGCDGFIGNNFCQSGSKNIFQNFITYTCNDAGTASSTCTSLSVAKEKTICYETQKCLNGVCSEAACDSDNDCNDNNPRTEDKCLNPGTVQSSCQHNSIACLNNSDCGINRYLGQLFCDANNSYDKFITFTCNNAGTTASVCTNITENKLTKNCTNGCSNGLCIGECVIDSDCTKDYFSEKYCSGSDVYKDLTHFSCQVGKCQKNTTKQLVSECSHDCENGKCKDLSDGGIYNPDNENYPFVENNQTTNGILSPVIYNENVESNAINESVQTIELSKAVTSTENTNRYFWPVFLLILLILFIILVIVIIARF